MPRRHDGRMLTRLEGLLTRLETDAGPPDPVPTSDGWELVLRGMSRTSSMTETRDRCLAALRHDVGIDPEAILRRDPKSSRQSWPACVPMIGSNGSDCAPKPRIAGAAWKAYPGIGRPGVERIELFSGQRAVLALDSNAARVLYRLGYGEPRRSYDAMYREIQAAAAGRATGRRLYAASSAPTAAPARKGRMHSQRTQVRRLPAGSTVPSWNRAPTSRRPLRKALNLMVRSSGGSPLAAAFGPKVSDFAFTSPRWPDREQGRDRTPQRQEPSRR